MRTVLVTGANRGLGLGFLRQLLLRPQYSLILSAVRSRPEPDSALGVLERKSGGRVRSVVLEEVSDVAACQSMADEIRSMAPGGVNVLINNAGFAHQPKPMTPLRLPTVEGALDYQRTWSVNAFGPLLVASTLLDNGLLVAPTTSLHTAPSSPSPSRRPSLSPDPSYPIHLPSSLLLSPLPLRPAPIIANITSLQASLSWASELWTGGSPRDELFFHPIYAASKVALHGVTVHMARILRPGWLKTTMGRTYANLTVDEAASKVLNVIESWRTLRDSGQYVDEENRKIPW